MSERGGGGREGGRSKGETVGGGPILLWWNFGVRVSEGKGVNGLGDMDQNMFAVV